MPIYEIAGLKVEMTPRYALTARRAAPYRVVTDHKDMCLSGDGGATEEYAALARDFYEKLLRFDGFLLHASAVELDGKAYLFSAPSGTGKSTHAAYWREQFGARIINDDKPAIRRINDTFYACGTPFSGKHDISQPVCVEIGGIAMLRRGEETTVSRLDVAHALWALLDQTIRPTDAAGVERMLGLLEELLSRVPVFAVHCTNDAAAAHIVQTAICAERD